ncbi:MAG: hypothetical protein ACRCV9_15415 [Burkholderiaceae bacterium]|jgi:hypothetical protein
MANKQTSSRLADLASEVLDTSSSKTVKSLAGSVLTQSRSPSEATSKRVATLAAQVLQDGRFGKDAKSLAGSALSQKQNKK